MIINKDNEKINDKTENNKDLQTNDSKIMIEEDTKKEEEKENKENLLKERLERILEEQEALFSKNKLSKNLSYSKEKK